MERYALQPPMFFGRPCLANPTAAVCHRAGSPTLAHPRRSDRTPGQDHAPTRRPRPPRGPGSRKIRLHQLHGEDDRGAEEEWEGVKKEWILVGSLHSVAGHTEGLLRLGVDVFSWCGCPMPVVPRSRCRLSLAFRIHHASWGSAVLLLSMLYSAYLFVMNQDTFNGITYFVNVLSCRPTARVPDLEFETVGIVPVASTYLLCRNFLYIRAAAVLMRTLRVRLT